MFRKLFSSPYMGTKSGAWTVRLSVIGLLVLVSLFTAAIAPALNFVGVGELERAGRDLPNVTGFVKVWGLQHREPMTTSQHRFRIENDEAFLVKYFVEFKHSIVELSIEERYTGRGSVASSGETELQGWLYIDLDADPAVPREMDYTIDAYTRIEVWKKGDERTKDTWKATGRQGFRRPAR